MIAALRRRHACMVITLAVLGAALFIIGLIVRPEITLVDTAPGSGEHHDDRHDHGS